jgi:hypothetical protein
MTDEQVQRIVDALSGNPWEPWVTVIVALASALLGYGLSQLAERSARRRRVEEKAAEARRAAAAVALKVTREIHGMSAGEIYHRVDVESVVDDPAVELDLSNGVRVSGWWQAEMFKLLRVPASRAWDDEDKWSRAQIMTEVTLALRAWAAGELADEAFTSAKIRAGSLRAVLGSSA